MNLKKIAFILNVTMASNCGFTDGDLFVEAQKYACPKPFSNMVSCKAKIAKEFSKCSKRVSMWNTDNSESINKCKDLAKAKEKHCRNTCK